MRIGLLLLSLALAPALSADLNPEQQAAYDRLTHQLVAPCCWTEAAATHRSPAADEVRREIISALVAGRSEPEVLAAMKARYGERILIVPEGGKAELLFWAPVLLLLLTSVFAGWTVRALIRRRRAAPAADGPIAEIDESEIDW